MVKAIRRLRKNEKTRDDEPEHVLSEEYDKSGDETKDEDDIPLV